MRPLADILSTMLLTLWPRRRHQELLLDLGERKGWSDADRAEAVGRLADWLIAEVGLPEALTPGAHRSGSAPRALPDVPGDGVEPIGGVGIHTVALARLAGVAPKTLANTLADGLRSDRRDHRWLLFLSRVDAGDIHDDAWIFHRRSPGAVARALAARACADDLDAADALLVLSLVALWQRRRRTDEARASRGVELPRRVLPKPIAALESWVLSPSQIGPLVELGVRRGGAIGQALIGVALDAALTEAHLAPHRARRSDAAPGSGESWLRPVHEVLDRGSVTELLGETERGVFRWRVARMRAYRSSVPTPGPDESVAAHPYVALARAIDAARSEGPVERGFHGSDPGYFMLLPQARRLGLLEDG